jgi:membrane peptidoglycan carboxypeptidase
MTVGTAIRRSVNTVAVKVLADLTPQKAIEYARLLGITSPLDPYMPLALGASAVRPLEMCSAYSVFANLGKRAVPRGIVRVLDRNGDIIEDEEPVLEDTNLRPEAVQQIDEGLRGVVTSGTGRLAGAVPEARGKTGTTSGNRDAWFDGYTKELSTVVWVASEHRTKKGFTYKEMPRASGARLCVPVWRRFMLLASPLQRQINEAIDRGEEPGAVKAEPPLRKRHAAPEAVEPDAAAPLEGDAVPPPGADDPLADDTMTAEPATPPSQPPAPTPVMEPMPAVQPTGRISSEPRAPEPPREVTYRACADTGLRATRYCPITVERRTRASAVPRNCTTHAGEPDG